MTIVIVGAGAAGIFAAINIAELNPLASIIILEKTNHVLSKVKISGGGRCNVTNATFELSDLIKNYPRGSKTLKQAFQHFSTQDTVSWFKKRGLELKTEPDGRMFPQSNKSQSIVDCFMKLIVRYNVKIIHQFNIIELLYNAQQFKIESAEHTIFADKLIIATGGNTNESLKKLIQKLGHHFTLIVPSLFTFNVMDKNLHELSGLSMPNVKIKIMESAYVQEGPILITHWGFSGPAILKLSAWAAIQLAEKNYCFDFQIQWIKHQNTLQVYEHILSIKNNNSNKSISNPLYDLPKRLWHYLLQKKGFNGQQKWQMLSKNDVQNLAYSLCADVYTANGKTIFKEEFVSCGGLELNEINLKTMQSKFNANLFFAGEVLNFDGITGGFNFQNAWTSAWLVAQAISL